ncbi:hypothetical protein DsansV1_C01g0000701 [Dioscorea sansibarensis]
MAAIPSVSSSFISHQHSLCRELRRNPNLLHLTKPSKFNARAAKLPAGLEKPRVEPKLTEPFLGFTNTAEIWNSRACMIGIIGIFVVELISHKGILQIVGVEVGKGLNLPL